MKYYVISGETSGDQHAAKVLTKLTQLDTNAQFRGMGGDASLAAGQELVVHQKEMAFMGFWEILINLRKISQVLKQVKQDIIAWQPDAILLVDYPGFNFKIAKFGKALGIPIHYYIIPKVWAWKESRIERLKKHTDYRYSILPFEEAFLTERGLSSTYVGNPSKEEINAKAFTQSVGEAIGLLPGSRKQEIDRCLPVMLEAIKGMNKKILVAQAPGFDSAYYHQFSPELQLVKNDMHGLLNQCSMALVTSGTATLETALMRVPQVVCYKSNNLSYQIAKRLVKVKYISLVNLILNKETVTELIQDECNAQRVKLEIQNLTETEKRSEMLADYAQLNEVLGDLKPSNLVAEGLFNSINTK